MDRRSKKQKLAGILSGCAIDNHKTKNTVNTCKHSFYNADKINKVTIKQNLSIKEKKVERSAEKRVQKLEKLESKLVLHFLVCYDIRKVSRFLQR